MSVLISLYFKLLYTDDLTIRREAALAVVRVVVVDVTVVVAITHIVRVPGIRIAAKFI